MRAVAVAVVVAAAVPVAAVTAVAMATVVVAVGGGPIIWRPDLRDVRRDLRRRAHVVGDALSRLGSPAWRARGAGNGRHWPSLAVIGGRRSSSGRAPRVVHGAWRKLVS